MSVVPVIPPGRPQSGQKTVGAQPTNGGTEFGHLLKYFRRTRWFSKQQGILLKEKVSPEDEILSQSRLAEAADFDHSYVSRLESGARMPTRDAVDRLGEALKLEQPQLDSLLAAAGFLPRDVSSLLSSEPVIGEILDLLQDEAVPSEYRDNLRQILHLLAQQARFARRPHTA